ncbi:MAG: aminopeptidase P family protein [Rhodospirillales bacterium]|nr:aminopeptidase P family protein [Rhodospirillales bacterium]
MSQIKKQLAFTVEEYKKRLDGVRKRMAEKGLDGLIVHSPENICYLSGYQTSGYYFIQTLLVAHDKDPILVTRLFEQRNIDAYSWLDRARHGIAFTDSDNPSQKIAQALKDLGLETKRIGVDFSSFFLPVEKFEELKAALPNARIVNGAGVVEEERKVKSPAEIDVIRRACRVSEAGMRAMVDHARPGITENELAGEIHKALIANGSEYPGLPVFLATGWRSEIPHANWSDKVIAKGEVVFCELTGVVKRYSGPLLRCVVLGKPTEDLARRAAVCEEMLEAALRTIKPGIASHDANAAVVAVAEKAGMGSGAINRCGYSIGINFPPDWGEGSFLDLKKDDRTVLKPGMCFHVPRSMRLEGKDAVSISESVLVTEKGCEVLTDFSPRKLIVK